MAKSAKKTKTKKGFKSWIWAQLTRPLRWLGRWALRGALAFALLAFLLVLLFSVVNPPTTHTIWSEKRRLGEVDREWVPLEDMAPVLARSVVAAEDARFCLHWGIDVRAIRAALADGGQRGASTLTQQVVKNVFLWQGRSWGRKALETLLTPMVELIWSKRRIVEVYLNVAEMDEGVFGAEAAARRYFGVGPEALSATQAARLAAILPDPKGRSASRPSGFVQRRAAQIRDGAATPQGALITARAGDRIQWTVTPGSAGVFQVFDVQDDGVVSAFGRPRDVHPMQSFDGAMLLDDYAGAERLYFVLSEGPIGTNAVRAIVERKYNTPIADLDPMPGLQDATQRSVLISRAAE